MTQRIFFKSKLSREAFFKKALANSKLSTWEELYKFYAVPRAVFQNYRYGILSLPEDLYLKLTKNFSKSEIDLISQNIKYLDENWGRLKGGKNNFEKNKEKFDIWRQKGTKILQELNSIPLKSKKLDAGLAYFIGLLIGDGFTNKYGRHYLIQFVGHKTHELGYYGNIICPYIKNTLGLNSVIKENTGGNFIRVNIYSRPLHDFLTEEIGIPAGRKSHTVLIPEKILSADKDILLACIAGIYDAEGCIFMDKRKSYSKPYPRIDLHMINSPILGQIKDILSKEGISCSFPGANTQNSKVLIYGEENIKKFLSKVPLKNPKHLLKLKENKLM